MDEICPCRNALTLLLCKLLDAQESHLLGAQFVIQDKTLSFLSLSSRTLSISNLWLLEALQKFHVNVTIKLAI